jgi:membrane-bound lytic murein transglycosylase D
MPDFVRRSLLAVILIAITLPSSIQLVHAADGVEPQNPYFPKPPLLEPNVDFWKQIYTEYGVGDFVLHDRNNLGVIYGVVRVGDTTNQGRAATLARSEIQRLREKHQDILTKLAAGVPPEELGPEGVSVSQAWGCPCPPDVLLRAADSIRVQQGLRQKVDEGLRRARKLLPRILAILREHKLPMELAALPMVESSYNPQAFSKAGAVGLWQFIRSTGKEYLTITRKRDDRRDPIRATDAAAHLLRHNYDTLGSWPLAIVAYNHGREGILTARAAVGSSAIEEIIARYSGPRFGFASRNFYAEFLAALEVVRPAILEHTQPPNARPLLSAGVRQG